MNAPLVSVVIPVHDRAHYLGPAIDSVQSQTHKPVELIVVDDGSSDGSARVAEERGARVIRQCQRGVSAARNAGIEAATGDYIAFLDSDDLWPQDRLARQVVHLERHPELEFVLAYAMMFVDPDSPTPSWLPDGWLAGVHTVDLPGVQPPGPGQAGPVAAGMTLVARARLFERIGGYDPSYTTGQDIELLTRAADAGAAYERLPFVALNYRLHETNSSPPMNQGMPDMLRLLRASVIRRRALR